MKSALVLTFADRWAAGIGGVVALGAIAFFLLAGQMIASGADGLVLLATPGKVAIFAMLAVLVGLAFAVQIAALRMRLATGSGAAGTAGLILAFIGASCCSPLIWPAVLSFLGVSGVTLLGVNLALHRWFWLAVTLAALSLLFGIWTTARAMTAACRPAAEH